MGWRRLLGPALGSASLGAALGLAAAGCGRTELLASTLLPVDNPPIIGEGGLGNVPSDPPPYDAAPTLFTFDGSLRDHCGEEIVLRGVAELIAWTPGQDAVPESFEIAKTGANAVRVMWRGDATAAALDVALSGVEAQGLIAVLELQEGNFTNLPEAEALALIMDYWMDPAVFEVLVAHQSTLVLEISSWVNQSAPSTSWVELYAGTIAELRNQGLLCPVAIVHPCWSFDLPRFSEAMAALLGRDSVGNVLSAFDAWVGGAEQAADKWAALTAVGVAGYVSEFSSHQVLNCMMPIDGPALLDAAQAAGGGWFAWAWGSLPSTGCPGALTLTTDGTFATLTPWGTTIALEHPAGLSRTTTTLRTSPTSPCPL
jgi:mannan endo-1,4-beta-mannosidase